MAQYECDVCEDNWVIEDPDAWNGTAKELTCCPACNPDGAKKPKTLPGGPGLVT